MEHRRDLRTIACHTDSMDSAIRQGVKRGRALHGQAVRSACGALAKFLIRSARLRTTRKQLARLDDHGLRDIGLNPGDAEKESQKPFWRV